MLIKKDLFDEILINPAKTGGDKLFIVSGYANATMASKHLAKLKKLKKNVQIQLIVGMCNKDGLYIEDHIAFQRLASEDYRANFGCRYLVKPPPVHSKIYAWFKGGKPFRGFCGSANYSQNAFSSSQREVMTPHKALDGSGYFNQLVKDTIDCRDSEVPEAIYIYKERQRDFKRKLIKQKDKPSDQLERITVSLLDSRTNDTPTRSGLNWGQRPGRNKNQAYISIPASICRSGFFPKRTEHFTILTDDNKVLTCVREQDNGKAITTPGNNSQLGEYFRNRLALPSEKYITKNDLLSYGRTGVDIYKIENETYFMDFSTD